MSALSGTRWYFGSGATFLFFNFLLLLEENLRLGLPSDALGDSVTLS